jgi:hypothetical protein
MRRSVLDERGAIHTIRAPKGSGTLDKGDDVPGILRNRTPVVIDWGRGSLLLWVGRAQDSRQISQLAEANGLEKHEVGFIS